MPIVRRFRLQTQDLEVLEATQWDVSVRSLGTFVMPPFTFLTQAHLWIHSV